MNKPSVDLVRVMFDIDSSQWHGSSSETLWAERCRNGLRKIDNIPFLTFGISFGDFIETDVDHEGIENFISVAEKGGHSTYRLIVHHGIVPEERLQLLADLGCLHEVGKISRVLVVSVSVPPDTNIDNVYKQLEIGEFEGVWDFEESNFEHSA